MRRSGAVHNYRTGEQRKRTAIRGHVILSEREARNSRRLNWQRVVLVFGLLAALAGAIVLYRSPLMRVQEVQIAGARYTDSGQLTTLAGLEGRSIVNLSLDGAKERIAALPNIKAVQASRVFPNKVRITVTEREPIGFWQTGASSYVIDREGTVLDGIAPAAGAFSIIETSPRDPLQPGQRVDPDTVALADLLAREVTAKLGLTVTGFEFSQAIGVTVAVDAGYRVIMGDSQNTGYKLAVWQALEQELGRESMAGRTLDLRFGDRPSLR